ncbi:DNA-binding response OmpR family regulator [Methylopila capsulata]|uniref:DNA-binding response OmpR family regulator n=1 Tax=Methylopila capsulata TaxID=61654 RepID=A0A9W6IU71_9HYPH|nr:response regulator transcription factor [Methylopila capsulata]MBM7852432.1 DNA-binding response OmpR family regulator [Methylopila capsulata]GLK56641.1 DNA-binding response regulator [Methylopila capsulata]
MRVLVVEDDPVLLDGLKVGLGLAGATCDVVSTCGDAEAALATGDFDAVVLDRMLPDGSGLDVLKRVRASGNRTPILLLTALDETSDRIAGLDAGADDYIGKPFDLEELAARIRAIARRGQGRAAGALEWRDLTLDPATMSAARGGEALALSRREFAVLAALIERRGAIASRAEIEDRLYGWQEEIESNAVEVHVHHLRAKLGRDAIETVRGLGYRMGGPR